MTAKQALVRVVLPQWSHQRGWGLLLLLYSALLSRGCDAVHADMDSTGDTRLVDGLGYCSMELVNLLLTGTAVSNVFDGNQCFGELPAPAAAVAAQTFAGLEASGACPEAAAAAMALAAAAAAADPDSHQLVIRGVMHKSRVGLLTLFEWYRYVEVGQNLKSPQLPVWVVCSESHFSVLALGHSPTLISDGPSHQQRLQHVDTATMQPTVGSPLLLQFFDGLAQQQGPIALELRPTAAAGGQGWISRMADMSEERGVWQGRPIPPLECVLETKWQDCVVTWHGCDPIL